eukprot:CAMPEP_0177708206 /NCGR_PEP_ID=MMETSP0484_2-20121128/10157_1 /TAXON_ID=354590 /ORGANISM="Rhodomonas lens, Strain RHODO" /LENGTH=206 /DNA_ID=CAMNT_0019219763 /DNA_START=51 /DNA_END=671 /DNA_ORIENTATION=-
MSTVIIGVLALQGDFAEHIDTFKKCENVECREIRKTEQLEGLHALVIPGGESTVMIKLLVEFGMFDAVKSLGSSGTPMFGTCAGCIMLAQGIEERPNQKTLALSNVMVARNAYGTQVDSFESGITGDDMVFGGTPLTAVLIRAPKITKVGPEVKVLASHGPDPVLVQQDNLLLCTFHPEITGDTRIHAYFTKFVRDTAKPFKLASA